MTVPADATTRYDVRFFRSDDEPAFRALYEHVFGQARSPAWFRWKFVDNPYADHVPIVVAERDGDPVGFRSFFPLRMRLGASDHLAYQPCDTMVHPDHRRRGLFSRMNAHALDRYGDGGPAFFFNFPNAQSTPGNVEHGWREVGTIPMYYRPQNPVGTLRRWATEDTSGTDEDPDAGVAADTRGATEDARDDRRTTGGGRSARAFARAAAVVDAATVRLDRTYTRLLADARPRFDVRVERHDVPPIDRLVAAYRRWVPEELHAVRSPTFLRWRLANPAQRYDHYVATADDETVAALIVSPQPDHLRIVDALPRTIDAAADPLERLLRAALDDHADRAFVTAFGRVLPRPLAHLFYPDTSPPLSTLLSPTSRTLFARDADLGGIDRRPVSDWCLSRLDLDTT